jgi:hypothetical protein
VRFEYVRNSYHDEFFDFRPRSYFRASSRTSSRALSHFSHGPNHRSYDFGSRENIFVPRCFDYDGPRSHRGNRFPRRHGSHFEPRHLDGLRFPSHDSHPTGSKGEVPKTVKTSSGCIVKCWIPKIYLTNPSTEPSIFSCPM